MRGIYFEEIWAQDNIYISVGTLFALIFHSTVTVSIGTGSELHRHILSPAEVRKICYLLAKHSVQSILTYSDGGGRNIQKHFNGRASYKSFGTSGIDKKKSLFWYTDSTHQRYVTFTSSM
jgi:Uri superfamily endonuclease